MCCSGSFEIWDANSSHSDEEMRIIESKLGITKTTQPQCTDKFKLRQSKTWIYISEELLPEAMFIHKGAHWGSK